MGGWSGRLGKCWKANQKDFGNWQVEGDFGHQRLLMAKKEERSKGC